MPGQDLLKVCSGFYYEYNKVSRDLTAIIEWVVGGRRERNDWKMTAVFKKAYQKAFRTSELRKEDLVVLLSAGEKELSELLSLGDELRREYLGSRIELRGIIEISNHCIQDCLYCGLRRSNKSLKRYRLEVEEVLKAAQEAISAGYRTIVLQGGEDKGLLPKVIGRMVKGIKQMGAAVTLSLGEQDYETYKYWREIGADRYLLKQETADPNLYSRVRPGKSLRERLEHQEMLKKLGYQLGAGCIVGLPGQTVASLAEDLLLLQKMGAGMVAMGPFIPNPHTPLGDCRMGSLEMTLKMVALARILMPHLHIPATTALDTAQEGGRKKGLMAGANVIMLNITPQACKPLYEIYPKKSSLFDSQALQPTKIAGLLREMGRTLSDDYGHCLKPVVR